MLILKLFPLFIIYCCYSHQQDLATTAESEPDMMKMHTPAKRSGEEAQVMIQTLPSYLQTKSL
jgi:hypothetical protein